MHLRTCITVVLLNDKEHHDVILLAKLEEILFAGHSDVLRLEWTLVLDLNLGVVFHAVDGCPSRASHGHAGSLNHCAQTDCGKEQESLRPLHLAILKQRNRNVV